MGRENRIAKKIVDKFIQRDYDRYVRNCGCTGVSTRYTMKKYRKIATKLVKGRIDIIVFNEMNKDISAIIPSENDIVTMCNYRLDIPRLVMNYQIQKERL